MLILTDQYPNPREPERAVFTKSLVMSLKKYLDIVVLSPLPWFPKRFALGRFNRYGKFSDIPWKLDDDGVVVYYPKYPMVPKMGLIQPYFMISAILPLIKKINGIEKFDLINGQFVFPNGIVAAWIGKKLKIPVVISALGCDINLYTDYFLRRRMIQSALFSASLIVAVSRQLREKVIGLGQDERKVVFIPNGVDMDAFRPEDRDVVRREAGVPSNSKVILYVGRLSEEKGIDILIRAVEILRGSNGDFRVLIVGDGDLRQSCDRMVSSLGLEKWILLCGNRPHADLPRWYSAADVICLPSLREGMPNVVLESLSCGRPVVASRVGALPDLINECNGFLVPPGDPRDLADKLRLSMSIRWDPERIRSSVSQYSWKRSALMYCEYMSSSGVL